MLYHLTKQSSNVKTGPIPVSTSSKETCPTSCPFQGKGCYADGGPLNVHWSKITEGTRGVAFSDFLEEIKALPPDQLWRYGQAGDLPGENETIDASQLVELAVANNKRPVIIFTHKPRTANNLEAIRSVQKLGMQINLSANSIEEADKLKQLDLPVVVVINSEYERTNARGEWTETHAEYKERTKDLPRTTPDGNTLVVCPATFTDTNCDKCRICSHERKGVIVGFPAHGNRKKIVNATVT